MKLFIIIGILITILIVLIILFPKPIKPDFNKPTPGKCSANSCSAIDDVNAPDYNVREVIKNTLLIEQHLAEKRKYCKACIVKHFLLSLGLLNEAIWMAGEKCKEYAKLEESETFYNNLFNEWKSNMENDEVRLDVLSKLREWRREMIELYYFNY